MAQRLTIAERVQSSKITLADGKAEIFYSEDAARRVGESKLRYTSHSAAALTLSFCIALAVAAMVFLTIFWDGGTLEAETVDYVPQYTDARPLLRKVFDPNTNDRGTYVARELSYFFDYLDAQFYTRAVVRLDPSFFIPISAIAVSLLTAVVFAVGVRRVAPNLDPLTAVMVLGCAYSSFVFVSTLSIFYRSAKPLLALVILEYLFHVRAVQLARNTSPRTAVPLVNREAVWAFGLATTAGLLDRQGVFYAATACGVLFLHWYITRQLTDVLLATAIALVLLQAYNLAIAPWLINVLNGYWPSLEYQLVSPKQIPAQVVPALHLVFSNIVAILGGFLPVTAVAGVVLIVIATRGRSELPGVHFSSGPPFLLRHGAPVYTLLILCAHVVMFAIMITRHPPVYYYPDHRHWYYPFPAMAILLFGLVLVLNAMLRGLRSSARRVVQGVLLVIIVGNLVSLPRYRDIMLHGPYFGPVHGHSQQLKAFLRFGQADPTLPGRWRAFGERVRRASPRGN
jgi:hypothetical protein